MNEQKKSRKKAVFLEAVWKKYDLIATVVIGKGVQSLSHKATTSPGEIFSKDKPGETYPLEALVIVIFDTGKTHT